MVCVSKLVQSTQNNKLAIFFLIFQGKGKNGILADKHQRLLQIDTIILGVARHAQIIQDNKFAISLQYLKKSFLPIDTMVFDGDGQAFPKLLK